MKENLRFFEKQLDIGQPYIRLFIVVFIAAVLSKGAVIFRGYAVDDYVFISGIDDGNLVHFLTLGRYIQAAIALLVDAFGSNLNDLYFLLGIVTLFLQAGFVVSILRFVGMEDLPAAGLVGSIMVAHPYLAEALTFREGLPGYSVAMIFSIFALEMAAKRPATWQTRVSSGLATFALLLTYQVFLNYFAVAIAFAFIFRDVLKNRVVQAAPNNNIYLERAVTLTVVSTISALAFVLVVWLTRATGLATLDGRTKFIQFDQIPERMEQISTALVRIYWDAEPVFPGLPKTLVALMLVISVVTIIRHLVKVNIGKDSIINSFFAFLALAIVVPMSLGVIIPLGEWWPVPRVIAHVAIITGLLFLGADLCVGEHNSRFLRSTIFVSRFVVLVGFIFLSNQIFADQQRINQWDRMEANRIISRLEMLPNFSDIRYVYVKKGSWGYPATLRTIQGDMNISAYAKEYASVQLLTEVSGYRFEKATGLRATEGEKYCEAKRPWPHGESVTIEDDMAIICLTE